MLLSMSAPNVTLSVAASPKVRFPLIVALPVTVRFPPTERSALAVTFPVNVEVSSTSKSVLSDHQKTIFPLNCRSTKVICVICF